MAGDGRAEHDGGRQPRVPGQPVGRARAADPRHVRNVGQFQARPAPRRRARLVQPRSGQAHGRGVLRVSDGASAPALRRHWLGRPGWALLAIIAALLVVVPVAMLVTSIFHPDTQMWREQWDTRLPHQIVATLTLLVGVITVSTWLGVSLAWLVSAYTFPGRRVLSWALVLPLAMPGY